MAMHERVMAFAARKLRGAGRRAARFARRGQLTLRGWLGRPLVVFEIDAAGLREHCDPLIRWLLAHSRCTLAIAVTDAELEMYRSKGVPRGAICLPKSQFAALGCVPAVSVSLHPENGSELGARLKDAPTQRVVMQHGLSDKAAFGEIGKPNPLADFDAVFLIGPVFREGSLEIYRQKHPATFARLRFLEIGQPKTDALFNHPVSRESVLSELGLDPALPTVCYAPTWEKWASLEQHGVAIIEALASLPVNVIVKLHHVSLCTIPYDWILRDGHGGKDWREIIGEIARRRPNLKLATGQDAVPYLVASDLLVSDASGVAFEYALLDRPVVFFDVPQLFAVYGQAGIHYWGRECGEIVPDVEALKLVVADNLKAPRKKATERGKWISRISYSRGDATRKAGEAILALATQPRRAEKAPPA